jgi:hypothetical protein
MTAENWDLKNTDARRGPVRISDSYIHVIKNSTFDDSSRFFLYMLRTTVGTIEDVKISKWNMAPIFLSNSQIKMMKNATLTSNGSTFWNFFGSIYSSNCKKLFHL